MSDLIACHVTWSGPATRRELLGSGIPKARCVYALTTSDSDTRAMIRFGASADCGKRIREYQVLDLIPGAQVSWWVVSEQFAKDLEPVLHEYFASSPGDLPEHLTGKSVAYCINRELDSIEYKVERLLLESYRAKHGCLPPGNPRTGSNRAYLAQIAIVEEGPTKLLEAECAKLSPTIPVKGDDLIRLLW